MRIFSSFKLYVKHGQNPKFIDNEIGDSIYYLLSITAYKIRQVL